MYSKIRKYSSLFAGLALVLGIASCSGKVNCDDNAAGNGTYKLVVDNTSPVPLVNGESQLFYVFVSNIGTGVANNLTWSVSNGNTTSSNLFSRIKQVFKSDVASDVVSIKNPDNCTSVAVGQTCKILLNAKNPGTVILKSSSSSSVGSNITQNVVSAYNYPQPTLVESKQVLTLSPLTSVNYGNGLASYTFFIINNGSNSIALADTSLGELPAGMSYKTISGDQCPSPLPSGQVCQVRLTVNGESTISSVVANLTPSGSIANSNIPLATQESTQLFVSNAISGNINLGITPTLTVNAAVKTPATSYGVINNTGSAQLIIGRLVSNNNNLTISSDNCSGQVLAAGAVCSYSLSMLPNAVSASGSASITIPYANSEGEPLVNTASTVTWHYVALETNITPQLNITRNPSGNVVLLNNGTLQTTSLTLTNNTTVAHQFDESDGTIQVLTSSLLASGGSGVTYAVASGGTCIESAGYIALVNTSGSNSCTYNISMSSTAAIGTSGTGSATISYNYKKYSGGGTTPSVLTNSTGGSYSVSYLVQSATATLSTPTLSSGVLLGTGQGATNPVANFSVTNVGASPVSGTLTFVNLPTGFTADTSSCNNLAAGANCNFTLTMDTTRVIAQANLNTVSVTFTGNSATVNLPSVAYSVLDNGTNPIINASFTVDNCESGTLANGESYIGGVSTPAIPTCLINTGNAAPVLKLQFTNNGVSAASAFAVDLSSVESVISGNYIVSSNTCTSGSLLVNESCLITLSPVVTPIVTASTTTYDILSVANSLVAVPYTSTQVSGSTSVGFDSTVTTLGFTLASIGNVPPGSSTTITLSYSNWYGASPVAPSITFQESGGTAVTSGLSVSACTMSAVATNSYTYSCTINAESSLTQGSYVIQASQPSTSLSTSTNFTVFRPWVDVGNAGFSAESVQYTSLALASDNTPYVAYADGANSNKATVMKYDGSAWVTVGNPDFSAGQADYISLAIESNGTLYVAYVDGANSNKATVMKYDGTTWTTVGNSDFADGEAGHAVSLDLAAGGIPYIAYLDATNGKATAMKYNGSAWVTVGNPNFSAAMADYLSLAIAADGTAYIAYEDLNNISHGATVMRYIP